MQFHRLFVFFFLCGSGLHDLAAQPGSGGTWINRTPLPDARQEMPHAVLDGKIYVAGGILGSRLATDLVDVYDPSTDTWTRIPSMPVQLHHLGMAVAHDKLYVIGGYVGSFFVPTNRVFEYDPREEIWTEKEPMPNPRGAHVAVTFEDQIYVFGGITNQVTATAERYDPQTDTWTSLSSMPTPREHLAAAVLDSLIYVIGGRQGNNNNGFMEAYSPTTDRWYERAPMPTARGGLAAATLNGRIYVFGGEIPGVFSQNEAYDPVTHNWDTMEPMPVPRHGIGTAVVADTIFIIGGAPVVGFGVTDVNSGYVPPQTASTSTEDLSDRLEEPINLTTYPNPVQSTATFRIALPVGSEVRLQVFDVFGRKIGTIVDHNHSAGVSEVEWDASGLAAGLYLVQLQTGNHSITRKITILK